MSHLGIESIPLGCLVPVRPWSDWRKTMQRYHSTLQHWQRLHKGKMSEIWIWSHRRNNSTIVWHDFVKWFLVNLTRFLFFWVDAVWLQDEVLNTSILASLEADGEPAYELLACPGYLWLSALLFGLPSESPASPAALCPSFPFWRARCAFVWQLSIADASERGCGQCPSLFKASLADLIGEPGNTTSPLAAGNFLDPRSRSELQHATAPLLRNYKRGVGMPQVGSPQAGLCEISYGKTAHDM